MLRNAVVAEYAIFPVLHAVALFSSLFTEIFVLLVTMVHDMMSSYTKLSLRSTILFSFFKKILKN